MTEKAAPRQTTAPVPSTHPTRGLFLKSLFCSAVPLFYISHWSLWPVEVRSRLRAGLQSPSPWGCNICFYLYSRLSETQSFSSRQCIYIIPCPLDTPYSTFLLYLLSLPRVASLLLSIYSKLSQSLKTIQISHYPWCLTVHGDSSFSEHPWQML